MAVYSYKNIQATNKNIELTKGLADRNWRPEVYCDIYAGGVINVDSITTNPKGSIDYAIRNVTWKNDGGSPALQVRYGTSTPSTPRDTIPHWNPDNFLKSTLPSRFTLRPHQAVINDLHFYSSPLKINDTMSLHLGVWYKDREGKNYIEERVLYYTKGIDQSIVFIEVLSYEYDWEKKQWIR